MSDLTTPNQSRAVASASTTTAGSMLEIIANASRDPSVDVAKLAALLDMQERVLAREAEGLFNSALARVTYQMPRVAKNGTIKLGEKGSIPFARWEDMDKMVRPRLEAEGFTLSFDATERQGQGGGAVISCTLLHANGHSRTVAIPLPLDAGPGRNNLQAMGSTLSYGKRYCVEMLLNIVREGDDDDGLAGGTRYIDAAQKEEIVKLLQETKAETTGFLRFMAVRSLDEIEARNFTAAVNALMKKRAAAGKGAAS